MQISPDVPISEGTCGYHMNGIYQFNFVLIAWTQEDFEEQRLKIYSCKSVKKNAQTRIQIPLLRSKTNRIETSSEMTKDPVKT